VNGEAIPISIRAPLYKAIAGSSCPSPEFSLARLRIDGDWVTRSSERILWLPSEYRPRSWASYGRTLAISSGGGRVTFVSRLLLDSVQSRSPSTSRDKRSNRKIMSRSLG
jgi:hypothetical protein